MALITAIGSLFSLLAPAQVPGAPLSGRLATSAVGEPVAPATPGTPVQQVTIQRETWVMGTSLVINAQSSEPEIALRAISAAFDTVRYFDDLLSTWRRDSELAELNHARAGKSIRLSPTLAALLEEVSRFREITGGTFDPAIGPLVDAYDLRGRGRKPDAASLKSALEGSGLERFELDPGNHRARRLHPSAWIDSGGFGKGAALRAAAQALSSRGISQASLNFGGQVVVLGDPPALNLVAVAHPGKRNRAVAALRLSNASVATSGQAERPGHILDPRSGQQVPPWGSVSVVARDPLAADILATALFVMGPEKACRWAASQKEIAVLLLVESGPKIEARWNRPMNDLLLYLDSHDVSQTADASPRRISCDAQ